ncbi:MAG: GNAT family N-acetyltransferase [Candidatus Thorarchaeota archaeon]|nr:GNAT family N-acetyltransferase [Candidatus Thorarchaeota archaeon]
MSEYTIRNFSKEDLASVVEINRVCLPENYPDQFFLGLYYHAPLAFLVAENASGIIGYIMCRIERGVSSFGIAPVKKGHVVSVAVLPGQRRKGVGSALVEAAMKGMISYGAQEFFLEVRKTNEAAILVYEHLGFQIRRVLKGYYRDGEDAYLMVRSARELRESPYHEA